jgi:hypothetical protein
VQGGGTGPFDLCVTCCVQALAVQLTCLLLLAAAGSCEAARPGSRTLLQRRTVAPRSASPGSIAPSGPTGSGGSGSGSSSGGGSGGSGSGSPTSNPKVFNPLGPSPFKETECEVVQQGQTYDVRPPPHPAVYDRIWRVLAGCSLLTLVYCCHFPGTNCVGLGAHAVPITVYPCQGSCQRDDLTWQPAAAG